MVIPAQRLSDLESAAWQTDKRLDRIETSLFDLQTAVSEIKEKADQHGVALSATMQDLRDFRISTDRTLARHTAILDQHTAILEGHTAILERQSAMLDAIVKHLGIEVPVAESATV